MTADAIKNRIAECASLFGFEYDGKQGNVDPYYIPETKSYEYLLFFNGHEQTVYDIDSVMNTPFFDGKSLSDIAGEIDIIDW